MKQQKLKLALFALGLALATARVEANRPPKGNGTPPSADEIFTLMDSNNDNKLSKSEIQGPLKNDFSNIDTDGDGYISKDELENAPKPQGRR